MIINSAFKPAWWLTNCHGQTIYSTIARRILAPINKCERIELPDGDFIDLAWATNNCLESSPIVILLHGLGGSAASPYIAGLMHALNKRGFRAVLMHFRGASQEPNRLLRAYHSGDTKDFNHCLTLLSQRFPKSKKAVVGFSLGGNVLLKWLGEQGPQSLVNAAIAVSVPYELRLVADKVNKGISSLYQRYLLYRLKQLFDKKKLNYEQALPQILTDLHKWDCFWTFDENVTAPLHGFAHVHDYYRKSSCRPYLQGIATKTLLIHALDDPFMTKEVVPGYDELSKATSLELSLKGGHVGFISGAIPGKPTYWLEERIPSFLSEIFDA